MWRLGVEFQTFPTNGILTCDWMFSKESLHRNKWQKWNQVWVSNMFYCIKYVLSYQKFSILYQKFSHLIIWTIQTMNRKWHRRTWRVWGTKSLKKWSKSTRWRWREGHKLTSSSVPSVRRPTVPTIRFKQEVLMNLWLHFAFVTSVAKDGSFASAQNLRIRCRGSDSLSCIGFVVVHQIRCQGSECERILNYWTFSSLFPDWSGEQPH